MSYNKMNRRATTRKSSREQSPADYEQGAQDEKRFAISFENPNHSDTVVEAPGKSVSMEECLPQYGSPEWQKYVIGLLNPDEVYEGYPRCFGLRRIANLLLGPIVEQGVSNLSVIPIVTAEEKNSRAVTVVYDIHINWKMSTRVPIVMGNNGEGMCLNDIRKFSGTADCIEDINSPYGRHPAASAETKAESRALKKALCLNIITAEEKVSGYDDRDSIETRKDISESKISEQLKNFILAKLSKLDLNVDKIVSEYLTSVGAPQKPLNDFTMSEGQQCFNYINYLQQNR
jgi:hypothetical protein